MFIPDSLVTFGNIRQSFSIILSIFDHNESLLEFLWNMNDFLIEIEEGK